MSTTDSKPPQPHFDNTQPKLTSVLSDQKSEYEDCTPCRLMGSATFTALGFYTYYSGRKQLQDQQIRDRILKSGSRFGIVARKTSVVLMSGLLVGMGAYRLVN